MKHENEHTEKAKRELKERKAARRSKKGHATIFAHTERGTVNIWHAIKDSERAWDDVLNGLRLLGYHQASEEWALHFLASKGIKTTPHAIRATWAVYQKMQARRAAGKNPEPTAEEVLTMQRAFGQQPAADDDEAKPQDTAASDNSRWLGDIFEQCGLAEWLKGERAKGHAIASIKARAKTSAKQMELHIYAQMEPIKKH